MIKQTTLTIGSKQILVMLFEHHLTMVEFKQIEIGGFKIAFDPCQMVHVVPENNIANYHDFENPDVIDSLKSMARAEFVHSGAN